MLLIPRAAADGTLAHPESQEIDNACAQQTQRIEIQQPPTYSARRIEIDVDNILNRTVTG